MPINACDACGWTAVFCSMIAFGSFGVPIKSKVARDLDIDPLVFQTYKTTMCFVTSWLILFTGEEKFAFTPWGIVSGLFWVPGGIGTIYAVQNAGLAIGIGINSAFIVLVSFIWGIFIFDEHVHSRLVASISIGLMMLGIVGMAYFSAPTKSSTIIAEQIEEGEREEEGCERDGSARSGESVQSEGELCGCSPLASSERADDNDDGLILEDEEAHDMNRPLLHIEESSSSSYVILFNVKWRRRTLGILCAVCAGSYGGSIMVPMKWAPDDAKGLGYLISFAIGASLVTITIWIFRFLYLYFKHYSISTAREALPSLHLSKMWPYGCTCGIVWSIGNFFSIISVEYLGEGVGYSVVQSAILVSGLWGIFYFREIRGATTISMWLISASLTVSGILLLSYEHHEQ